MPTLESYKNAVYVSGLPSEAEVIADMRVNPERVASWLTRSAMTGGELQTGRSWLGHVRRLGIPAPSPEQFTAFQDFSRTLDDTPAGAFKGMAKAALQCSGNPDACGDIMVDAVLAEATHLFQMAATQVPVLGWIVQWVGMAVNVGVSVWLEAQGPPATELPPLQIEPTADTRAGNDLIDIMGQEDWTPIWMPEHDASAGGYLQAPEVGYPETKNYGWRLWMGRDPFESGGAGGGVNWSGGLGVCPGQAAVARQWQVRGTQAETGSTRLDRVLRRLGLPIAHGTGDASEVGKFTTYGMEYYLPSLGNLGQTAWGQLQKVSANMYRVNTRTLAVAWYQYWNLWRTALGQFTTAGMDEAAAMCLNVLGANAMGDVFADWPVGLHGEKLVKTIPEKYRYLVRGSLQDYGPVQEGWLPSSPEGCEPWPGGADFGNPDCSGGPFTYRAQHFVVGDGFSWMVDQWGITERILDNLYNRQRYGLRTLQCAYLTGREPGLQGKGSAMFTLWENMRAELLNHPALSSVDLTRVPREDYTGTGDWRRAAVDKRISGGLVNVGAKRAVIRRGDIEAILPATGVNAEAMLAPLLPWGQGGLRLRLGERPGTIRPAYVNAAGMPVLEDGSTGGGGGGGVLAMAGMGAVLGAMLLARGRR